MDEAIDLEVVQEIFSKFDPDIHFNLKKILSYKDENPKLFLKNVKVHPNKYQGYAFGIGIDRLAMLKYGINDLRAFFECDYRWLNHFGFDPLDVPTNYRGLSR